MHASVIEPQCFSGASKSIYMTPVLRDIYKGLIRSPLAWFRFYTSLIRRDASRRGAARSDVDEFFDPL